MSQHPSAFDRMITVDTPDIKGREQIFRVHLAKLKLTRHADFYSERLAALTPGMSGADIANVCNEAALHAARKNLESVDMINFESAIDRVIGGAEKKNKVIGLDEVERLLGRRQYHSKELRNIDRFRHGPGSESSDAAAAAAAAAAPEAAAATGGDGEGGSPPEEGGGKESGEEEGGKGSGGGGRKRPGLVVAT
ncbi:ATP-dependent zinc metalloprotease FTSH 8, mitochondrial [Tetrabaena socialis]|uniref:ATP-dependent zinc metalloprotease FTSH 8, mitochondrial n=1 Tax=Tetrabaena socialis TaxID=47790 RepID=A0A2J8A559_9CHLO|nr:ATP-dependent zinc metalloprotease FTSH 8, mitochondrial [Tetrabaena socialis]|eukprot:PNH07650.1 ATP-dependent zinc metalloprotease FTSH 8, mitochondrial [Tetrabaena socialis]